VIHLVDFRDRIPADLHRTDHLEPMPGPFASSPGGSRISDMSGVRERITGVDHAKRWSGGYPVILAPVAQMH
jgi:hypothetical protein